MDREAITAAFDALDAAFDGAAGFDCEALTTPEQLGLLERWERLRRRIPAAEHPDIRGMRLAWEELFRNGIDINPGNKFPNEVAFDIPAGTQSSDYVISLHDSPYSPGVTVALK